MRASDKLGSESLCTHHVFVQELVEQRELGVDLVESLLSLVLDVQTVVLQEAEHVVQVQVRGRHHRLEVFTHRLDHLGQRLEFLLRISEIQMRYSMNFL